MKMLFKKARISNGFTLIEILVAVTILSMIFAIIFGTFFYMIQNTEEQEERAQIYQRAGFILNNISQNVASAFIPFRSTHDSGQTGDSEDAEQSVFLGTASESEIEPLDSVSFFTTNPRFATPTLAGEIAHVVYSAAEDGNNPDDVRATDENNPIVLACTVVPGITGAEEKDDNFQWNMNIKSLKFEYFDGDDWTTEWSYEEQEALPVAVKVDLEIADSQGNPYTFSTVSSVAVNTPLHETEIGSTDEEELEPETLSDEVEQPEEAQDLPLEGEQPETPNNAPQPSGS